MHTNHTVLFSTDVWFLQTGPVNHGLSHPKWLLENGKGSLHSTPPDSTWFNGLEVRQSCAQRLPVFDYLVANFPVSKWDITPTISGLTLLITFMTGVMTHLLSGMSHQVPHGPSVSLDETGFISYDVGIPVMFVGLQPHRTIFTSSINPSEPGCKLL
jgi:hypothetical protein